VSKNSEEFFFSSRFFEPFGKKVLACVYDYRRDCILLYSGVRAGPDQCRCRIAPVPGRILLLFTFLCEEIPGMCMEWSSFLRVRGLFPKDNPVARNIMVRSHDWCVRRLMPGILQGRPVQVVSMGSPWHRGGM
jgi:hypothetical protein